MATAANPLPPPPGQDSTPPPSAPTTPMAASPSPAQPTPQSSASTQLVISVVRGLRAIAKAAPGAAPGIAKINDIFQQEVLPAVMKTQSPGEPMAPPVNG